MPLLRGACWLLLCGCVGVATTMPDAGATPDAAFVDAGDDAGDAASGSVDAGPSDAGDVDAGPIDLSCLTDGGLTAAEQALIRQAPDTWSSAPGTSFSTFCHAHEIANLRANEGCDAVILDWSGAVFDDANRQLILWGGGHGGYFGNEVYGFELATQRWKLLRAASPLASGQQPTDPMPDGAPVSRHTYDGMVYLPTLRRLFAFGGATAPIGSSTNSAWFFDPLSASWTRRGNLYSSAAGHFFTANAFDQASNTVFARTELGIWAYDVAADTWDQLIDFGYPPYYPRWVTYTYRRGVVVPSEHLFIAAGGSLTDGTPDVVAFDVATRKDVTATYTLTGDTSVIRQGGAGLDLDPRAHALVAWSGGAPAMMDLKTRTWVRGSAAGAPAVAVPQGTYGRWRYVSYLNVFVLVNQPGENVWFYKHTAGCGP